MSRRAYGWTRKGLARNVKATRILAADRSRRVGASTAPGEVGNHADGWNVLKADGTVDYVLADFDPDGSGATSWA